MRRAFKKLWLRREEVDFEIADLFDGDLPQNHLLSGSDPSAIFCLKLPEGMCAVSDRPQRCGVPYRFQKSRKAPAASGNLLRLSERGVLKSEEFVELDCHFNELNLEHNKAVREFLELVEACIYRDSRKLEHELWREASAGKTTQVLLGKTEDHAT